MHNRNFEVYIFSDDKRMPEYKEQLHGEKTSSCYIPSEAGKPFRICWKSNLPTDAVRVRCTIDGRYMGGNPCLPGQSGRRWGVRNTVYTRKPFQFSKLVLSEDDDLMVSEQMLQNLGTIEVELTRIHAASREAQFTSTHVVDVGPINERAKKAGSHCVSLGQASPCNPSPKVVCQPLHPAEGIWAKFIFRYRPRAILQAQGVLPSENHAGPSKLKRETASVVDPGPRRLSKRKRHSESSSSILSLPGIGTKDPTPKISGVQLPQSQPKKHSSNFQQGKGKSTAPNAGNIPATPPRKRAKTEPRSPKAGPSVDDEVIDLTEIKREGSTTRVKSAWGDTIDLTLESDSD